MRWHPPWAPDAGQAAEGGFIWPAGDGGAGRRCPDRGVPKLVGPDNNGEAAGPMPLMMLREVRQQAETAIAQQAAESHALLEWGSVP